MTDYSLMDGVSGRPGVGSSGTQPPSAATATTGNYITGTVFKTTSRAWLKGYRWWVTSTGGQSTAPQKFALWCMNRNGSGNGGTVIPGSTVTSGTLVAGWNTILLPTPLPLTIGWAYNAETGWVSSTGIPFTTGQFGSGQPYAAGITNGPLVGFSDTTGSNPDPWGNSQSNRNTSASDPSTNFSNGSASSAIRWLDVIVTDQPPADDSYSLFPNVEGWGTGTGPNYNSPTVDSSGYAVGNTFSVIRQAALRKLRFLSGQGATALPTRCALWDVATQSEIPGTEVLSPSWLNKSGSAASPGDGWVYVSYPSIALPPNKNMIAAVWSAGGAGVFWRAYTVSFWGTGGTGGPGILVGGSGLDYGLLKAPSTASGVPLQGGYSGPGLAWAFPGSWNNPENDWTDVEVVELKNSSLLMASGVI